MFCPSVVTKRKGTKIKLEPEQEAEGEASSDGESDKELEASLSDEREQERTSVPMKLVALSVPGKTVSSKPRNSAAFDGRTVRIGLRIATPTCTPKSQP